MAPIALYPDPLLAQVLMASTYPLEVVQAARFVKANPSSRTTALNEELEKHDWDDSVKSLVSFPQVLEMMDEKLDWTQKLGDAFLDQQKDDHGRGPAAAGEGAGRGQPQVDERAERDVEPAPADGHPAQPAPPPPPQQTIIKIEPTNPQVIYVPTLQPDRGLRRLAVSRVSAVLPTTRPGTPGRRGALSFGVGMAVGARDLGRLQLGRRRRQHQRRATTTTSPRT